MWQAMSCVSNKVELLVSAHHNFYVQEVTAYYSVQIIIAVVTSFLKGELQMI